MSKYKKIGDIVTFKRGYDLPSYNRIDGNYPIISSSGISGYHKEYKADGEGLVTGRYGTLGQMYYVNGKYWPHNTALYATDFKGNYPKYVYFLMKSLGNLQNADKSTVPGINRNDLHEIKVPFIERQYQKEVTDVLSNIEGKIELNNRINAELEAMAKTVYDYWFVQFDFPNEDGKPYRTEGGKMVWSDELKREIPNGWEVKKLEKVINITRGASPRPIDDFLSTAGIPWIKISDATKSDNRFIMETKQFIIEEGASNSRYLSPDTLILSNSATPAIPRIVKIDACVHDGWLIINNYTHGFTPEFMFHYFDYERPRIISLGSGSIFKNLKTEYIKELDIIVPPLSILNQITPKLKLISEMIYLRTKENQQLTQLRDWLLPMLMNGQVTVIPPE